MIENRKLRVFLCHSSHDKPFVRELYRRLNVEGWINPWLDEEELLPGQDWDMEIEKATKITDAVVICLSTNSVDKEGYVQHEIRLALKTAGYKPDDTIFIIPIRLDKCTVPMRVDLQHYVDFFPPEKKDWAYQRLLKSLQTRYEQILRREAKENKGKKDIQQAEENVRQLVKCPQGHLYPKEFIYCPTCNSPYSFSGKVKICSHCNTHLPNRSEIIYCTECGKKL